MQAHFSPQHSNMLRFSFQQYLVVGVIFQKRKDLLKNHIFISQFHPQIKLLASGNITLNVV